nr:MAG TPA: hypothetical protein [Caudoviricetes sp.]
MQLSSSPLRKHCCKCRVKSNNFVSYFCFWLLKRCHTRVF